MKAGFQQTQVKQRRRHAGTLHPGVAAASVGLCRRNGIERRKRKPCHGRRTNKAPTKNARHRDGSPQRAVNLEIRSTERRVKTIRQPRFGSAAHVILSNLAARCQNRKYECANHQTFTSSPGAPRYLGIRLETNRLNATGELAWRPAVRPFGVRWLATAFIALESGSELPHSRSATAGRSRPSRERIDPCLPESVAAPAAI